MMGEIGYVGIGNVDREYLPIDGIDIIPLEIHLAPNPIQIIAINEMEDYIDPAKMIVGINPPIVPAKEVRIPDPKPLYPPINGVAPILIIPDLEVRLPIPDPIMIAKPPPSGMPIQDVIIQEKKSRIIIPIVIIIIIIAVVIGVYRK